MGEYKQSKNGRTNSAGQGRQFKVVQPGDGDALPNAEQAERSVISACMQWPDEWVPQLHHLGIGEEVFYVPAHRILWRAIQEHLERGVPIEMMGMRTHLKAQGVLEDVGGDHGVAMLWQAEVTDAHVIRRAEEVLGAATRRKAWITAEKVKEAAKDPSSETLLEVERLAAEVRELHLTNRRSLSLVTPLPGDERARLDVGQPIQALARELGAVLGAAGYYRRAETRLVVTVDEEGRTEAVTPRRLRGAVGEHVYPVAFDKLREREVPKDIPVETAATLLETDAFLNLLPELKGVAQVRMPVWKGDAVELARPGFDPETGIFCADRVSFDDGLTVADAGVIFDELLGGFEFENGEPWLRCRSGALQVALMVGQFCTHLLQCGVPRPMAAYVANQPGAGKTLLASMALCHVHGKIASEDYPPGRSGQEEIKKLLDVAAIEQAAVLWFDDVPEYISSHALNRFVTASRHRPRILGKSEKIDVAARTQIFVTGNHTRVTRDLIRRAVVVELFVPGEIQERTFKQEFTQELLTRNEWRSKSLAACWAMVKNWVDKGCEMREHTPLSGFSGYTALVGGVMAAAELDVDPFAEPELPMSGDEETSEMKRLLHAVAAQMRDHPSWENGDPVTLDDIVEVARAEQVQLVDGRGRDIIGKEGDGPVDAGARRSIGAQLKKWRGRHLRMEDGRQFQFGRREQMQGSVYPLTILD